MRQQRQIGAIRQRFWQRQRLAQNLIHALFKFRRMRSAKEQSVLTWIELVTQRAVRNRRMRLRDVPHRFQLAHGRFGGFVGHGGITQIAQTPDFAAEQLFHTRPVVRL
ncbi:hypothetical protein D3C80_1118070 [compost metagenome]